MTGSIRARIITGFTLLTGLLLAAFGVALYESQRRLAYQGLDDTLDTLAASIAALVEYDAEDGVEFEARDAVTRQFDARLQRRGFRVFDLPSGREVARSESLALLVIDIPWAAHSPDAPAASSIRHQTEDIDGRRLRTLARVFHQPAQPPHEAGEAGQLAHTTGVLIVEDQRELDEALRRLEWSLWGIAPAALLVALLAGWLLSRRIVGPIAALTAHAERHDARELLEPIPATGSGDELDRLIAVLNGSFAALSASFERQTRFTADAAHELRTPVAALRSHMEVALRRERDAAAYRQALVDALPVVRRMQDGVEALLLLARADAGEAMIAREIIDLGALGREMADRVRPEVSKRGLTLRAEAPEGLTLTADRRLIEILLANLLSNALRYSRAPSEMTLRVREDGEMVVIEVENHGVGIPEAALERVFDRFYRVDEARSRDEGGAGLGLSLCRWIAAAHHGDILAASTPQGATTFTVRLPRRASAE